MRAVLLLLVITALSSGCRSENHTAPEKVRGAIQLDAQFEYVGISGAKKQTVDFTAAVLEALKARGVTVEDGAKVKLSGRASLADEPKQDSKVGGPMAFFFVRGAYDFALVDAATGKELGRAQGALDLRELKDRALKAATGSYDDTAKAIVADAAPKAADQIIAILWKNKAVTRSP